MDGRGQRRLIDFLIRHGLIEREARAVVQLGEVLRRQMAEELDPDRRYEYAVMVDMQSGQQLGPLTVGTRDGVRVGAQVGAAQGHQAISVHTHPGSSSFSDVDASLLSAATVVKVMVIVGADGTWYVLSPEPGTTPPARDRIEELYQDTVDTLAPLYHGLSAFGFTDDEIWKEHSHGTWEWIAPALRLRYDRVTP